MKIVPDTNLLVRIAVPDDDEDQTEIALQLFDKATSVYLTRVALAETEWVLRSRYKLSEEERIEFFTSLYQSHKIVREHQTLIADTMSLVKSGMDFGDALIATEAHGSDHVYTTFDQDAAKTCKNAGIAVELLKVRKKH